MGKLIFFLGAAGAGKTTLAKALASRRKMTFLDMDILLRPAAEAIMTMQGLDPYDRDSAAYKQLCRDLGYRITMDAALENIQLNVDTVVVGPFTKETEDPFWIESELLRIGRSLQDVEVKVAYIYLPSDNHYYERISTRGLQLDEWKLKHWESFSASLARRSISWPLPASSIAYINNSSPDIKVTVDEIEHFIYS